MSGDSAKPVAIIRVNRSICAGHALCAARSALLYTLDDQGFSTADGTAVLADQLEEARRGAKSCPERAITIEETGG
jgi:ferredoxin